MSANGKMTDAEYDAFVAEVSGKIRHPSWCLAHGTRDTDSVWAADDDGGLWVCHSRDIDGGDSDAVGVYVQQVDVFTASGAFLTRDPAEVMVCEYDLETLTDAAAVRLDHAKFVAATLIEYDQSVGGLLPRPAGVFRHRTWRDAAMMG